MGINRISKFITRDKIINYLITFGAEFAIIIITVIIYKMVSSKFYTEGFSLYTISKRLLGFLMPLLFIGLGVSLPKFLPNENYNKQLKIHYSSLVIISSIFLVCIVIFFLMDAFFSKIVFGDYAHKKMCLIVLIYTFSLMYHNCVYNYFRGKFNFILSGFLQLLNLGIIPMVGLYFATNVFQYFLFMSVFTFGILIFTNFIYIPFLRLSFDDLTICFKKLTGYGIQRVPGDVVLGLLFSVPVFIASNYFSITIAGNIAFCLSLFNIIIALMSPVNIIILPQASRLVFEKNYLLLKKLSNKLLILSILIGVLALGTVYLMGDWILMLFGVTNYAETSSYLMIIFIGVIGFSVFSVIRSIIDAYYDSARISIIILLAFIIFMISMIFVKTINIFSEQNTLIAFSLSINILGLLAFLSLIKILNTHRN